MHAAGNCHSKPHKHVDSNIDKVRRDPSKSAALCHLQQGSLSRITCAGDQSQVSCAKPLRNAALEVVIANIHEFQIWKHIHAAAVLQPARVLNE